MVILQPLEYSNWICKFRANPCPLQLRKAHTIGHPSLGRNHGEPILDYMHILYRSITPQIA